MGDAKAASPPEVSASSEGVGGALRGTGSGGYRFGSASSLASGPLTGSVVSGEVSSMHASGTA